MITRNIDNEQDLRALRPGTLLIGHFRDTDQIPVVYQWTGEHLRVLTDGGPRFPANVLALYRELGLVWEPTAAAE